MRRYLNRSEKQNSGGDVKVVSPGKSVRSCVEKNSMGKDGMKIHSSPNGSTKRTAETQILDYPAGGDDI